MAIISGKQFFGGKPGKVIQSATAPQITIPKTPKKSIGETVATEVLGLGPTPERATTMGGQIFQDTLGSRGLGGAAKTIGRSIMAPTVLSETNQANDKRLKYADAADKIMGMATKEQDPAIRSRMLEEARSYIQQSSRLGDMTAEDLNLLPDPDLSHFLGQLGNTAATAAGLAGGGAAVEGANLAKPLTTLIKEGAKTGFKIGTGYGAASGASGALIEDKGVGGVALDTAIGGITGGAAGATLGAAAPILSKTAGAVIEPTAQKFKNWFELSTKLPTTVAEGSAALADNNNVVGRTVRRAGNFMEERKALKAESPAFRNAVNVGIEQPQVAKITSMSEPDKRIARQMLDAAEKDMKIAGQNTKIEIPGNTIVGQAKKVARGLKENGQYLGNEVVKKFPDTPINPIETLKEFNNDLRTKGIQVVYDPETNLPKLDFSDSTLGGVTGARERKILQNIFVDLQTPKTAGKYNTIRQVLFKDLELGKQAKVISKEGEAIAQRVRENLRLDIGKQVSLRSNGKSLGEQYLDYTQRVAEGEDTLRKFYGLMGKKFQSFDQYGGDISLRAGEVANRVLGNASADAKIVLDQLRQEAIKYGADPNINVIDQIVFNDILEQALGLTPTRSLGGQVKRATSQGLEEAVGVLDSASKGDAPGVVRKTWDAIKGATKEERLRALKALLGEPGTQSGALPGGITDFGDTALPKAKAGPAANPAFTATAFDSLVKPQPKITGRSQFTFAENLSSADRKVEHAAWDKVLKSEDQILADYTAKHGKIVNTDNFRPFFAPEGYNGTNSASVQEPSSYLAKRAYAEGLNNKGAVVVGTSGGSGAGKSSAMNSIPELKEAASKAALVLDSNFSNLNSALGKIRQAEMAGKIFHPAYVYREPVEAFENGVVNRMLNNPDEMGRLVPIKEMAKNTIGAWDVTQKLDDLGYYQRFVDNSLGKDNARLVSLEDLQAKINMPSEKELIDQLTAKAKELLDRGIITPEQYRGYIE